MSEWLITSADLHNLNGDHSNSPNLGQSSSSQSNIVIFDCRFSLADHQMGKKLYQQSHIPNAFHLDMETDLSGEKRRHGGRHPLPTLEDFTDCMQMYEVDSNTLIIAYDSNRLAGAARLWWLLRYFGHDKVKILDGGMSAWESAGYDLSTDTPDASQSGNFIADPQTDQVVDQTWLNLHLDDDEFQIIDSREAARYAGREEPIDPVAGHIPNAENSPWQLVTHENGFVKSEARQREIWEKLKPKRHPIIYCGSGVTACVNLFSLELAGIKNCRLYAASWSDWCSYSNNPIKTIG